MDYEEILNGCAYKDELELTPAEREVWEHERAICQLDFLHFLKWVKIIRPPMPGQYAESIIPFGMPKHIKKVIKTFLTKPLISILKARQIYLSTIISIYVVWYALGKVGANILLYSQGQDEAKELLQKCRNIYDQLPGFLKFRLDPDSKEAIGFPATKSVIRALPSTTSAGVGFTASILVWDEHAKHEYADANYIHSKPTRDSGGQVISIFTADPFGNDNLATAIFEDALKDKNGFTPLFFPYDVIPERDAEWYNQTMSSIPDRDLAKLSPLLYMAKNYPHCLSPDTLIATDEGILPICESAYAFRSGRGQLFEVTTNNGRFLKVTNEHLIMTPNGYKPLGILEPGSAVLLKQPTFAEDYVTLPIQSYYYNENRTILIDEKWGEFLGLYAGDGSFAATCNGSDRSVAQTVSIVCDGKDTDLLAYIEILFDDLFGGHSTRKFSKAKAMEVRKSRTGMTELFDSFGILYTNGNSKRRRVCVPPSILRSPRSVIRAFLRGVFEADGGIYGHYGKQGKYHGRTVVFCAKGIDFIRQVQFLLLGFGITSRVKKRIATAKVQGKSHKYTTNMLTLKKKELEKFIEEIGFMSQRKIGVADRGLSDKSFNKPHPIVYEDVIESIQPGEITELWDATVNPDHCFSANGIYVHNSIEEALSMAASVAVFDKKVLNIMMQDVRGQINEGWDFDNSIIHIYKDYHVGNRYVAASDVGWGVGADFSVTGIMDEHGEIVADIMTNNLEPDLFTFHSVELLKHYRNPWWWIENNTAGGGRIVIKKAVELGYKKLGHKKDVMWSQLDRTEELNKIGFSTNEKSRTDLFGALIPGINDYQLKVYNEQGLRHFYNMIRNANKGGKIEGISSTHDDYVIMVGICLLKRKDAKQEILKPVETLTFNPTGIPPVIQNIIDRQLQGVG